MKKLIMLLAFVFAACNQGFSPVGPNEVSPIGKGKPFATIKAVSTAFLSIPTIPVVDFYGVVHPGFGVFAQDNTHIYFTLTVTNPDPSNNFGTGVYPDPNIYTDGVPVGVKNFFKAEIFDASNNLVDSMEPVIYDAGETVPILDPTIYPYHESSTFDGFWISSGWANLTSENNGGVGTGEPTPGFLFPTSLADGSYTLVVTFDPINHWGQQTEVSQPFTLGAGVVTAAPFRLHGK